MFNVRGVLDDWHACAAWWWLTTKSDALRGRELERYLQRGLTLQESILDAPLDDLCPDELVKVARIFPRVEIRLREVSSRVAKEGTLPRRGI